MKASVHFVGAGPGAPDLITMRGWRALREADVVLYDSLVDSDLLDGLRGERIFVGKRCGRHALTQEEINELLLRLALDGRQIVRLKGGDPSVLGRVAEEALHLAAHGVTFEIVPGVSSATSVPSLVGIPLTHRGCADGFSVVSAHPRDGHEPRSIPPHHPRRTLVLLMAGATVREWTADLVRLGYPDDLPLAFISAACTPKQRVVVTTVACAADDFEAADLATPVLAVVGQVVLLRPLLAGKPAEPELAHFTEPARTAHLEPAKDRFELDSAW